jgi:hypothetical protein
LDNYGGVLPFQATGTWFGYAFYFRYRGGHASLSIGESEETVVRAPLWKARIPYGDTLGGVLDFHEFLELFATLVPLLEAENENTTAHPFTVVQVAQ